MALDKLTVFTAPVLVTPYGPDLNDWFIEGCTGGNKAPITGCDNTFQPPPSGGGCNLGLGIAQGIIGGAATIGVAVIAYKGAVAT